MMTMCVYVLMICVGMPCHIHANKMSDRNIVFFLKKYLTKKIGFILTINGKTTHTKFQKLVHYICNTILSLHSLR